MHEALHEVSVAKFLPFKLPLALLLLTFAAVANVRGVKIHLMIIKLSKNQDHYFWH